MFRYDVMDVIKICVVLTITIQCDAVSFRGQLERIARQNSENQDGNGQIKSKIKRRFNPLESPSAILGAPVYASHLPDAEPVLPGHTLLRPAIGMLKSSIKFPHKDNEDGAGVYGHIDHLSLKYGGRNERVMYSGFRRSLSQDDNSKNYVLILPSKLQKNYTRQVWRPPTKKRKLSSNQPVSNSKIQNEFLAHQRNNLKKILNIYPAPLMKKYGTKPEVIVVKDILSLIKSLRRDQEFHEGQDGPEYYIQDEEPKPPSPARVGVVAVVATPAVIEEINSASNKTIEFWATKDAFNHITINEDAPEHAELIPLHDGQDSNDERGWWFYQQSDFEEFKER